MTRRFGTLFAGYGGSSLGIRDVTGEDPVFAIDHWATAVAVHEANHPGTRHLHGDVWHYAPFDFNLWGLWASPTCTHFSKARGAPIKRAA